MRCSSISPAGQRSSHRFHRKARATKSDPIRSCLPTGVVPIKTRPASHSRLRRRLNNVCDRSWQLTGGELIRIPSPRPQYTELLARRDGIRTYKEIAEFVMSKIAELSEQDRAMYERRLRMMDESKLRKLNLRLLKPATRGARNYRASDSHSAASFRPCHC